MIIFCDHGFSAPGFDEGTDWRSRSSAAHTHRTQRHHHIRKPRPSGRRVTESLACKRSRLCVAATLPPVAFARTDSSWIRAADLLALTVRAVGGRYHAGENTDTAQCVVALAFGYRLVRPGVREPGPCNEYLAALTLATSNGRPIIAQVEIDQSIRTFRPGMGADHLIGSARGSGRYLDTRECAVQICSIMDYFGWKAAALIAHPHHLPRAQAVFAARGIETATPPGVRAIWDRESGQLWTRGPLRWAIREPFAILIYERRGWLRLPCLK